MGSKPGCRKTATRFPLGAHRALEPYIRQDMKFFVAKVNLKEHQATGLSYLRPIQFAFESPKFMLPIRLGMINAQGPQDLIVYALTRMAASRPPTIAPRNCRPARICPNTSSRSSRTSIRRCSTSRSMTTRCARSSPNTCGTWAGAIRAPGRRSRARSFAASACSGWMRPRSPMRCCIGGRRCSMAVRCR